MFMSVNDIASGDQIWAKSGSDWPQMKQILDFFQIRKIHGFAHRAKKCTESDLKKSPDLLTELKCTESDLEKFPDFFPIWGQADPL